MGLISKKYKCALVTKVGTAVNVKTAKETIKAATIKIAESKFKALYPKSKRTVYRAN